MEATITVTLDEEIVEEFKDKVFADPYHPKFLAGTGIFLDFGICWKYAETELAVFDAKGSLFENDEEFTEWLKENRPELFL